MSESRAPVREAIATGAKADRDGQDATLPAAYRAVRERSLWLTDVLEIEDFGLQPMPDASPAKWHLAHTTWFFETFLLKPFDAAWRPVDARYEYLFNSYYNSVGAQFPRAHRGDLSRPTVREVLAYRTAVDDAMADLFEDRGDEAEIAGRVVLGLHHEEQHQELLLTDLKYAFGHNPLAPDFARARPAPVRRVKPLAWSEHSGGLVEIGRSPSLAGGDRDAFEFDNETPRHRVHLEPFALADRCVTCGEYLDFMADGGYETPTLWLSDGWAWLRQGGPRNPLYWRDEDGCWLEYTLAGERPVDRDAPLTHVSFYEADAYARWAGARLPREAEWEVMAERHGRREAGNFVENAWLHPVTNPAEVEGPADLLGNQWEWTCSAYAPYPGFAPAPGALGEYNGKFMSNQVVLRGGSCVTPRAHVRTSYRNFFYPPDRWQFTGVRLARDL